jgi:hypothetical protein
VVKFATVLYSLPALQRRWDGIMEIKVITPQRRSDKKYTYIHSNWCLGIKKKEGTKVWVSHTQMIHLTELLYFIAEQ